jgi:hypothetical protein
MQHRLLGIGIPRVTQHKTRQFYSEGTLTRSPITPADQAEAYFLLIAGRLSKTTGHIVTVDGGLHEAFLR